MDGSRDKIGILALQGAFAKHGEAIKKIGGKPLWVRYPSDLHQCMGLIIPGGESTTMTLHIEQRGLLSPLTHFARSFPLFGTCAGMILMSKEGILNLLSISVERNAYGRQKESFIHSIPTTLSHSPLSAFFIRAPRVRAIHSSEVNILAHVDGEPVCVEEGLHLAATFHPELTSDTTLHRYFFDKATRVQCNKAHKQDSL